MSSTDAYPAEFRAPSGRVFVYCVGMPSKNGDVLHSPNGEVLHALILLDFAGSEFNHRLMFADPMYQVTGELYRDGSVIGFGGEQYTRRDLTFDLSRAVPIPADRRIEFLNALPDGTLIYVNAYRRASFTGSFELYIGDGKTMRQVPTTRVWRHQDGGEMYIETPEGTLRFPSLSDVERDPKAPAYWGETRATRLNPDDYNISISKDGQVTITKK